MKLSEELTNTENKISFSRQFYNDTVTIYNTKLQAFPSNIDRKAHETALANNLREKPLLSYSRHEKKTHRKI